MRFILPFSFFILAPTRVVEGRQAAFSCMTSGTHVLTSAKRSPTLVASNAVRTSRTFVTPSGVPPARSSNVLLRSSMDDDLEASVPADSMEKLQSLKSDLIRCCDSSSKPIASDVNSRVQDLESMAETLGVGQASSHSGLLSGEWELLYSPEDITRSSPFFWAFRKAFPDASDQIFTITDGIPAPIKEVGPANQYIALESSTQSGSFVSRVKVATLGGIATSMMTTRASIIGVEGLEGVRIKIDTTKPEESTILEKLGPLGEAIKSNSPPFPSGEVLEKVRMGSSEVVVYTSFCDETIRISRYDASNEPFVWRRTSFRGEFEL